MRVRLSTLSQRLVKQVVHRRLHSGWGPDISHSLKPVARMERYCAVSLWNLPQPSCGFIKWTFFISEMKRMRLIEPPVSALYLCHLPSRVELQ